MGLGRWLAFASGCGSMQLAWQLEFIIATPLLLRYGAAASVVSQIWTAGPVALILITGPLTRWSDSYFATGRCGRIPFVGALSAVIILSLGLVPLCAVLDANDNTPKLVVLFFLFSVLNGACNLSSGFQRTCCGDLSAASEEGVFGHSIVQASYTLGGVVAGIIGLVEWRPLLAGSGLEEYQLICILGVVVLLPTSLLQLATLYPEHAPKNEQAEKLLTFAIVNGSQSPTSVDCASSPPPPPGLWQTLKAMPPMYIHLVLQQLVCWTGLYPCWLFLTAYFACDVYQGDPNAPEGSLEAELFDQGQEWGSGAIMWLGVLSFFISFVTPVTIRTFGETNSYVGAQCLAAGAMVAMYFVTDKWYSLALFLVGTAPSWAANGCVPWVLCDKVLTPANRGFGMTQLFTLSSLSQPLCGLIVTPFITRLAFRASFLVGGVLSLISAFYGAWLFRRIENSQRTEELPQSPRSVVS